MFPCISCASVRRPGHRGHRNTLDGKGLTGEECSPINFISFRVEPGASCRLSYGSNQNAWQLAHRSMVTCLPNWASSVWAVISFVQPGHFMEDYCSWLPGPHVLQLPQKGASHE